MRIRSVLLLSAVSLVLFALCVGAVVYLATQRSEELRFQRDRVEEMVSHVFELHILAQEYVSHHEDRPKSQWYLEYDRLAEVMASPTLTQPPSAGYMPGLQSDVIVIKRSFDQLAEEEQALVRNAAVEEQLSNDILLETENMMRDAGVMIKEVTRVRTEARRKNDELVYLMLAVLALAAVLILTLLDRRIIRPILRLRQGSAVIGKGDLDYKVGSRSPDEIGELSRDFDAMTSKLKESYESLEQKVRDRTRELRALSHRNKMLLESIGDGVIAIDRAWNITLWNPATARLTGWDAEEAIGKPFRERVRFIREHDRKEDVAFIEEAMVYGEVTQMTAGTLLVARDGREIPVGDSAAPVIDDAGAVDGVIIVFRDASKEKESSLLRTDFAYASHQLRTPVNKALWGLELLMEDEAAAPFKEPLGTVYRSVQDVQKLAERLLTVAEIDQHRRQAEFKDVDLAAFFRELREKEKKIPALRNVTLRWPKVPPGARAETDPKLLADAIHELIRNAVLYSADGSAVDVELQLEPLGLLIHVRDAGIGVSDEQKPLIFTKFFRGQNVPSDAPGSGLGLFIAREYVRLMGGKLWFESELGKGTVFSISIPRARKA